MGRFFPLLLLAVGCVVVVVRGASLSDEILWSFDEGLEGWGASSSSEMDIDVSHSSGELRGSVRTAGSDSETYEPHFDSPPVLLLAEGRQTLAFRMKYNGGTASAARVRARYGLVSPKVGGSADPARADWRVRGAGRVASVSNDEANAEGLDDGDADTYWTTSSGGAIVYHFDIAEASPLEEAVEGESFAVTELLLVAGPLPPQSLVLSSGPTALGPWTSMWTSPALNSTPGAIQILDASDSIRADLDRALFWQVTFDSTGVMNVAELRILPAVTEARFGLSPDQDFVTYTVPLWRRAAVAGLGADSPSPLFATYLTHLRIYVGDDVFVPAPRRYFEEASDACEAWQDGTDAGSTVWRVLADYYERVAPWVVTELAMYEDENCHLSLSKHVDSGRGLGGALASAWAGDSSGEALYDGICATAQNGGGGINSWTSGAYAAAARESGGSWLGLYFERAVTVRCVALCQAEDEASRATKATLQRSDDDGVTWTDHAELALPSSANVAPANPCMWSYASSDLQNVERTSGSALNKAAFAVDFIRVASPPLIRHVTGCVDRFFDLTARKGAAPELLVGLTSLNDSYHLENDFLKRQYAQELTWPDTAYATTFACPREGGIRITIKGNHLGSEEAPSVVHVEGNRCLDLRYVLGNIECTLPAFTRGGVVEVVVARSDVPELRDVAKYLSYADTPEKLETPSVSNIAACSVDLTWSPPQSFWSATAVTGYVVYYRAAEEGEDQHYTRRLDDAHAYSQKVTLGNVTTTTIVGLDPGVTYVFAVAAVSEDRWRDQQAVDTVDLYGRREHLSGAVYGPRSLYGNRTATLGSDVTIAFFDANRTANHGAAELQLTVGPTGVFGGEGHHGLLVVGDANVENCNGSMACCDGFDAEAHQRTGRGCLPDAYVCLETNARDVSRTKEPQNDPNLTSVVAEKRILKLRDFADSLDVEPRASCGPSLRLTASEPRQTGALWYARRLEVREGFDTKFRVRVSNPSRRCQLMESEYTHCRSRGGDGLAFVIQEDRPDALGAQGSGLGYEGINNSIAVELDTFFNPELLDSFENHVSVHTNGWRRPNSAHHAASLASTTVALPDLATASGTDGEDILIRVLYDPVFDASLLAHRAFTTTTHSTSFFVNGAFDVGGLADFGIGLGTLSVFVEDMENPVIITPLNLDALLKLNHGRAFVGLTASTGLATFQVHDILQWNFTSLRRDPTFEPPRIVNEGAGEAHATCSQSNATDGDYDDDGCVHA